MLRQLSGRLPFQCSTALPRFPLQENDPSEEAWRHDFTLRIPAIHAQRPALDAFGKAVPIAAVIASDQRFEYFGTSAFAVRLLQLD
jgi:hypothetical protein